MIQSRYGNPFNIDLATHKSRVEFVTHEGVKITNFDIGRNFRIKQMVFYMQKKIERDEILGFKSWFVHMAMNNDEWIFRFASI